MSAVLLALGVAVGAVTFDEDAVVAARDSATISGSLRVVASASTSDDQTIDDLLRERDEPTPSNDIHRLVGKR